MSRQRKPAKRRKTSAKTIAARLRAIKALDLRTAGWNYDEIAVELGYADRSGPFRAVTDLLATYESEAVENMRAVDNRRLDRLLKAHEPFALGQAKKHEHAETIDEALHNAKADTPDTSHAEIVLKTIRERARLNGLDAPVKTELSGAVKTTNELADLLSRLAGSGAAGEGSGEAQ